MYYQYIFIVQCVNVDFVFHTRMCRRTAVSTAEQRNVNSSCERVDRWFSTGFFFFVISNKKINYEYFNRNRVFRSKLYFDYTARSKVSPPALIFFSKPLQYNRFY